MLCDKCGNDLKVTGYNYELEYDDDPNVKTKLYIVQHFTCRNEKCGNKGADITQKVEQELGETL